MGDFAASSVRKEIKVLLAEGLYESAWTLASFLTGRRSKGARPESSDWELHGDAAFGLDRFHQASGFYSKALSAARASEGEGKTSYSLVLKCADCAKRLDDPQSEIKLLKSVPAASRPARYTLRLARLYERLGKRALAIELYREAVKYSGGRCTTEAALAIARLGGSAAGATASSARLECVRQLANATALQHSYKLTLAISSLNKLAAEFPACIPVLVKRATLQFDLGKIDEALDALRRLHTAYPQSLMGMDLYGLILRVRGMNRELSRLADSLLKVNPRAAEPWIVAALDYSSDVKNKHDKALEALDRVLYRDPNNTGALLAKGFLHIRHGDGRNAAAAYTKVQKYARERRFCVFQGLVEANLLMHAFSQAFSHAKLAREKLPNNAKSLTLVGIVLMHSGAPAGYEKAVEILKRALKIDPKCIDAVQWLAKCYERDKKFDVSISMLTRHLRVQKNEALHRLLGDAYKMNGQREKALEQYHMALAMSPDSTEAVKGIESLQGDQKESEEYEDEDEDAFDD